MRGVVGSIDTLGPNEDVIDIERRLPTSETSALDVELEPELAS